AGLMMAQSQNSSNPVIFTLQAPSSYRYSSDKTGYYPYARLADDAGNALALPRGYDLAWAEAEGAARNTDWLYRPLDERDAAYNKARNLDVLANLGLKYNITSFLDADIQYRYQRNAGNTKNVYAPTS